MSNETRNIVSPPTKNKYSISPYQKTISTPPKKKQIEFPHVNYFSPFLSCIDKDYPIRR